MRISVANWNKLWRENGTVNWWQYYHWYLMAHPTRSYLRTLAMSPRSTANKYRFSSMVKGFGRLVMIRLLGLPIPGTGVGPADSSCVCNMDKHTIQNVPMDTCNRWWSEGHWFIILVSKTHPLWIHDAGWEELSLSAVCINHFQLPTTFRSA